MTAKLRHTGDHFRCSKRTLRNLRNFAVWPTWGARQNFPEFCAGTLPKTLFAGVPPWPVALYMGSQVPPTHAFKRPPLAATTSDLTRQAWCIPSHPAGAQ